MSDEQNRLNDPVLADNHALRRELDEKDYALNRALQDNQGFQQIASGYKEELDKKEQTQPVDEKSNNELLDRMKSIEQSVKSVQDQGTQTALSSQANQEVENLLEDPEVLKYKHLSVFVGSNMDNPSAMREIGEQIAVYKSNYQEEGSNPNDVYEALNNQFKDRFGSVVDIDEKYKNMVDDQTEGKGQPVKQSQTTMSAQNVAPHEVEAQVIQDNSSQQPSQLPPQEALNIPVNSTAQSEEQGNVSGDIVYPKQWDQMSDLEKGQWSMNVVENENQSG